VTPALSRLAAAHDAVTRAGFGLAQICLLVIVGAYSFETVSRYFFAAPTSWSNEVVAYALCIGTFLALPEVTRQGGHISISILTDVLRGGVRKIVTQVIAGVAGIVCLYVGWVLLDANISQVARGEMLTRITPIPKIWISAWITYGFLGASLHFLRQAAGEKVAAP